MHVIAKSVPVSFWERQPAGSSMTNAKAAVMTWYTTASNASWKDFSDLKQTFSAADQIRKISKAWGLPVGALVGNIAA